MATGRPEVPAAVAAAAAPRGMAVMVRPMRFMVPVMVREAAAAVRERVADTRRAMVAMAASMAVAVVVPGDRRMAMAWRALASKG